MGRLPIGDALRQFLDKLSEGDPVALGLLGFVALLGVVAGAIGLVDRKARAKEKAKAKGRGANRGR